MADRIITFQYARANYDAYKKQTIPASNECMTKADVAAYLNADMSMLSSYTNNQLVPRTKISPLQILTGDFNNAVSGMILQPDGKIVVVGYFTTFKTVTANYIIRLNSDGTIDTSFNIGSGFNYSTSGIVQQTDGKFVIIGSFTSYNGVSANNIIRLNLDGSVDTSFNIGYGFSYNPPTKIAIQSDGKFVIAGYFTSYNGSSISRIIRLNSNGTRDTSFNPGSGFISGSNFTGLGVLSNGQIIVAGRLIKYNGVSCPMMIKINSDGTRDTSFQYTNTTSSKSIEAMLITLDLINGTDKITIATYDSSTSSSALERYLYNGSFNTAILSGSPTNSVNGAITAIHLLESSPVDLYLLSGTFTELRTLSGNIPANRIIRIDSNGNKDNTFNYGTGFNSGAKVIVFQTNGKYLLSGNFTTYNDTSSEGIVRLNSDGTRG